MGFNRKDPDSSFEVKSTSKDDASIVQTSSNDSATASSATSQPVPDGSRLVQRTLMGGPRSSLTGKSIFGAGTMMRGAGGGFKVPGNLKPGARGFGVGAGAFVGAARARTLQKASRKTSLPSVMASPVKGTGGEDAMDIAADDESGPSTTAEAVTSGDMEVPLNDIEKGKARANDSWISKASRRVSLASQALSQSLNAPPLKANPGLGLMGPPATPTRKGRSASSTYPQSKSPNNDTERSSPSTRRTTMSLRNSAAGSSKNGSGESKVSTAAAAASHPEGMKVLKDCVIFVDVRTDDGDEAGSLFVEMLEGVGARVSSNFHI